MKLYYKLALINALTRILIVIGFLVIVPGLLYKAAVQHTDNRLERMKAQLFNITHKKGMNQFIKEESDSSFADYTIFKEKYVQIIPSKKMVPDTIITDRRYIEGDTVKARILRHSFVYNKSPYLLEIGESIQYVDDLNKILSRISLYILFVIIALTVLIDLSITQYLLLPLKKIEAKLIATKHPESFDFEPVGTSTYDFRYLDNTISKMMIKIRDAFLIEKEFIANVSHELLTPVSILQSRLENMLETGGLNEETEMKVIESQKTLGRLKQIIKSLLLISQIENDQALKEDKCFVPSLIREVTEEVSERLSSKNIRMEINVRDEFEFEPCNRSLLFTMFFNLLNNAIKYNKESGNIMVTGFLVSKDEYEISINDTGIGIPPENMKSIFHRFKRFSSGEAESYGLGLAMVKTIADFHGIKLNVESEIGKGTLFTLVFYHSHG